MQGMMTAVKMLSFNFVWLIILSYYVSQHNCDTICKGIKSSINMKILNKGYHRDLVFKIEFDENNEIDLWSRNVCNLALQLHLPRDAYVNPDELGDLRRMNRVQACPFGEVDTEKSAHLSSPIRTYLYTPLNASKISMTLPIHFRYQKPKDKGGFVKLELKHPWVLLRCPVNIFKKCEAVETIPAPCAPCSPKTCQWHNISAVVVNELSEILIPVADLEAAPIIWAFTIFTAYAGCFYLLINTNLPYAIPSYD